MQSTAERLEQLSQSLANVESLLNETEERVDRCSERLVALKRSTEQAGARIVDIRGVFEELSGLQTFSESDLDSVRRRLAELAEGSAIVPHEEAFEDKSAWKRPQAGSPPIVTAEVVESEPAPKGGAMMESFKRFLGA